MRKSRGLSGQTAVVTGAASGIGQATVRKLARAGAKVHVCDIDGERAAVLSAQIKSGGGTATAHTLDVTQADAVLDVADRVFATDGRVDVLINNAGIGHVGAVEDTTLAAWRRVIEVNLLGVAHGVHAFAPRMAAQECRSVIINTASQSGLVPVARMAPYCASKYGVVGMSLALNAELAPSGVRVVALCPGVITTPIVSNTLVNGGGAGSRARAEQFYASNGVPPDRVADYVMKAIRRPRLIVVAPRSQVLAPYVLQRLSPALMQIFARSALDVVGFHREPSPARQETRRRRTEP